MELRSTLLFLFCVAVFASTVVLAQSAPKIDDSPASQPVPESSLVVTFPNANVFLSPYNWRVSGDGTAWAPDPFGPYLKFSVTDTDKIVANVDTTIYAGVSAEDLPAFKVIIDDSPGVYVTVTEGAKQVTLASGLTPDSHTVMVWTIGGGLSSTNGWSDTTGQIHLLSLEFSAGATLSAYPTIYSKNCLIYGDSYLESYNGAPIAGARQSYLDPSMSWATTLAYPLRCEVGIVAVGGSGYLQPGVRGYPGGIEYWKSYDSTHARVLKPAPDYVVNALGINDHRSLGWSESAVQEAVLSWLKAARATMPRSPIFLYVPVGGQLADQDDACTGGANAVPIRAAKKAFHDSNTYLIDAGSLLLSADNWDHPTWFSPADGLHPAWTSHGILAAIAMQQIDKALSGNNAPRTDASHKLPVARAQHRGSTN